MVPNSVGRTNATRELSFSSTTTSPTRRSASTSPVFFTVKNWTASKLPSSKPDSLSAGLRKPPGPPPGAMTLLRITGLTHFSGIPTNCLPTSRTAADNGPHASGCRVFLFSSGRHPLPLAGRPVCCSCWHRTLYRSVFPFPCCWASLGFSVAVSRDRGQHPPSASHGHGFQCGGP